MPVLFAPSPETDAALSRQILEADLTWTGTAFEPGVQVVVDAAGEIAAAGALDLKPDRRLRRRALMPGMVNAHSHAFQRGLRGGGERYPEGAGSFWSWREEMYELVHGLDGERFLEISRQAFREMLAAGVTAVGEFHYLHHGPAGGDWSFDELVARAAREAGIRLVLLSAYYRSGGFGEPLAGAQQRFATPDVDTYWRRLERLAGALEPATQSVGSAAHSLRAASPEEIAALWREARRQGLVFHLHLEEQRREIEECLAAYGERPIELLLKLTDGGRGVTAVHCTHSPAAALERLAAAGGRVCVCPTTEANLGDGIPDLQPMLAAAGGLALGTDSNRRISLLEEARWLEYAQRLAGERRGVVRDATGACAARLLRIATEGGAACLGLRAGRIAAGQLADLVTIDLDDPSLEGAARGLPESLLFGAADTAIAEVMVGGRWIGPAPPEHLVAGG